MWKFRALVSLLLLAVGTIAGPATGQEGYRISPGDVLRIEVIEDDSLNRDVLVAPDGTISFPLAGSVRTAGRTLQQVQSTLTAALEPNFASRPNVFVGLSSLASREEAPEAEEPVIEIFVIGEANTTGAIPLSPGTTLLQAFSRMGGFTNFAATERVQLRRTDPATGAEKIYVLNYKAIQNGTSTNGQVAMREGDVILVPQRGLFE